VKKLFVYYNGWGEHWLLGTLADNGSDLLFEYSPEALKRGLELSPLRLKLREQAYGGFPAYLQRLPGLISDSLPDGWGLLVMDRLFRKNGLNIADLSPLDRLAFLGGEKHLTHPLIGDRDHSVDVTYDQVTWTHEDVTHQHRLVEPSRRTKIFPGTADA